MHARIQNVCALLAALLLLALATATAGARNFSVTEQRFTIRWAALSFNASVGTVSCPVTLLGSLPATTLPKSDIELGAISGATVNNASCTGGSASVLTGTLPWGGDYVSFTGTLPRITRVRVALIGASFEVNIGGTACLVRTDTVEPALGEVNIDSSTGSAETLDADATAEIDLEDDRFLCALAGDATFSGRADVRSNASGSVITVRLI